MGIKLWFVSLLAALTVVQPQGTPQASALPDGNAPIRTMVEEMQQQLVGEKTLLEETAGGAGFIQTVPEQAVSKQVPILLYHHLAQSGEESDTMVYPETFRRQMQLLHDHGYTPVSFENLIAFVDEGVPLPERPVVITFDDGYYSNYEYAFPILKEYGFRATIFVIGSSIGSTTYYKDTDYPITPHFGGAEAREMVESGLISIHSHTYDLHQWPPFETGDTVRKNILPLPGEGAADYLRVIAADAAEQDAAFVSCGLEPSRILAFPGGRHAAISDVALRACGYRVTVTTDATRINTLVPGQPLSLVDLGRMNISGETTDDQLLHYLSMQGVQVNP